MNILRKWLTRIATASFVLVAVAIVGLLVYQRFSDGPTGPLAGGPFKAGEIVEQPVADWAELEGSFEFELVGPGRSRTAGGVLVDDQLYITCDLGFVWSRLPAGTERNILRAIWWFKTWHKDAQEDGRIRIRKDGRIHTANIERIEDPVVVEALKTALEAEAREYFAPNELGPRPQVAPNDIWFFRVSQG